VATTTQRGYGAPHQAKRREWKPAVDRGDVDCHAVICLEEVDGYGRRIQPGTPWNLGHTPDRSRWTGPEHERCNKTEPQFRAGYRPPPPGYVPRDEDRDDSAAEALRFFE
jgi:hypothetical protein